MRTLTRGPQGVRYKGSWLYSVLEKNLKNKSVGPCLSFVFWLFYHIVNCWSIDLERQQNSFPGRVIFGTLERLIPAWNPEDNS